LLIRYSPYLISALGIIVSLNKILNLICQLFYKHPKEYVLNTGEKVTPENIAPIFFVAKEKQERNLIIRYLEKHVSTRLKAESITRSQLINYFTVEGELDKQKVLNIADEVIDNLPLKEKIQLERYCSAKKSKKPFIQQLIINQLTLWKLNYNPETKSLFNKMKDKWTEVASWNSSLSKFTINQDNFNQIFKAKSTSAVLDENNKNDTFLLISEEINLNLLQDALIAYVFGLHQINESPLEVDVSMKEQVESNILFRLLKMNLLRTHKINYGIKYKIIDDVLHFSGVAKDYLQGKTLVIQIATIRNRILKEIRIHGTSESIMNHQDDASNENNYEVY